MRSDELSATAAVASAAGVALSLEEVAFGDLQPDEVLVEVAASGICHTDLSWWAGKLPSKQYGFPVVLGHETAGIVRAKGSSATDIALGDHVVVALTHHCGRCTACETGHPMLCVRRSHAAPRLASGGLAVLQGFGVAGFASAVVVPISSVVRIPADVPLHLGALIGCAIATGLGAALNIAKLDVGADVLVLGAGAVGAAVIAGAQLTSAASITVVEPDRGRRHLAEQLGATRTFGSLEQMRQASKCRFFDFTFEVVGAPETFSAAVTHCAPGGTCTLIGVPAEGLSLTLPWLDFIAGQKRLLGCMTGDVRPHQDIPRYVELFRRGLLPLHLFVGAMMPLDQINEAFAVAATHSGLRVVITREADTSRGKQ